MTTRTAVMETLIGTALSAVLAGLLNGVAGDDFTGEATFLWEAGAPVNRFLSNGTLTINFYGNAATDPGTLASNDHLAIVAALRGVPGILAATLTGRGDAFDENTREYLGVQATYNILYEHRR